jgi:dynein heavy chain
LVLMNAVCLLFYKKKSKETWDDAKKLLSDMNFLNNLFNYDTDAIPDWVMARLRTEYLARSDFNEDRLALVSQACATLYKWMVALDKFTKVKKEIAPKEKKLKEAEAKLKIVQGELNKKLSALKEVQDNVAALKDNLD